MKGLEWGVGHHLEQLCLWYGDNHVGKPMGSVGPDATLARLQSLTDPASAHTELKVVGYYNAEWHPGILTLKTYDVVAREHLQCNAARWQNGLAVAKAIPK